jgi:predicted phosphodiesterase
MPLRLAILSDLHVEKGPWTPPPLDADLVILAGDVGWGTEGAAWIATHLGGHDAVYVAGNREYWHHVAGEDPLEELRRVTRPVPGLRFLQDDIACFEFAGRKLRILGATLWTDYALTGDVTGTMDKAQASLPDYRNGRGVGGAPLTAAQVKVWSQNSATFLAHHLKQAFDGTTIVVTHHLPSAQGLKARRPDHVPTTCSVTDMDTVITEHGPDLWVHGHSHWDCDYRLGRTRIVSRQRGAPENQDFAPLFLEL